jgi:hypothetical protein
LSAVALRASSSANAAGVVFRSSTALVIVFSFVPFSAVTTVYHTLGRLNPVTSRLFAG